MNLARYRTALLHVTLPGSPFSAALGAIGSPERSNRPPFEAQFVVWGKRTGEPAIPQMPNFGLFEFNFASLPNRARKFKAVIRRLWRAAACVTQAKLGALDEADTMGVRMEQSHFGHIQIVEYADLDEALNAAAVAYDENWWRALRLVRSDGGTGMGEAELHELVVARADSWAPTFR